MNDQPITAKDVLAWTAGVVVALFLVVALIVGGWSTFKIVGRYQKRADASNRVKISAIEIRNQEQRIKVAQQRAEIRHQNAIGIREAQDEIAKTLTPLYVQFESVEAMKAIAQSGKNHTVVYIPSGANGIPFVTDANGQQVGGQPPAE